MAAFGTAIDTPIEGIPQLEVVERLAVAPQTDIAPVEQSFLREERVQRGDTMDDLLRRLGVEDRAASEFIRSDATAKIMFRQISPGRVVSARTGANGELQSLTFPLNGGKDRALTVERQTKGFVAFEKALLVDTQVVMKSAEIQHSLFGATDAAGIPDDIAMQMANVFGSDIDFHRDLRRGDRFAVVYETINYLGRPIRYGRLLAAEFVNNGKAYRVAWYADSSMPNGGGYYTADGRSVQKSFLRSPLEFSRITSGFSSARFHPVLQKWRAHTGIDYGAPTGTRIRATGDGVVEVAGKLGGYGNAIVLRHQGRYTTLYGHLSRLAPGIRPGARVGQGDIIGFVGATGLATGPHLHYEFRVDGIFRNPLTIALPGAPALTPTQLSQFRGQSAANLARIDLIRSFNLARAE